MSGTSTKWPDRCVAVSLPLLVLLAGYAIRHWSMLRSLPPASRMASVSLVVLVVIAFGCGVALLTPWVRQALLEASSWFLATVAVLWVCEHFVIQWTAARFFAGHQGVRLALYVGAAALVLAGPWRRGLLAQYHRSLVSLRRGPLPALVVAAVVGVGVGAAQPREGGSPGPQVHAVPTGRSAVIILLDEWSAVRSSFPWSPATRATTPMLSDLSREGLAFARVHTSTFSTDNVMEALLTGAAPPEELEPPHPVPETEASTNLLSAAARRGLAVGYVYSYAALSPRALGLDTRGWIVTRVDPFLLFGRYDVAWLAGPFLERVAGLHTTVSQSLEAAGHTLAELQASGRQFLLFVHVLAPHAPFSPAQRDVRYSGGAGVRRVDHYDDYLRTVDRLVSDFIRGLRRTAPDVEVVVFGDHGLRAPVNAVGKVQLGAQAVWVPLIVWGPDWRAGVDTSLIALRQLWPLVLADRIGVPAPPRPRPGLSFVMPEENVRVVFVAGGHCVVPRGRGQAVCYDWTSYPEDGVERPRPPTATQAAEIQAALGASVVSGQ